MHDSESLAQSVWLTAQAILREVAATTTQIIPGEPVERDSGGAWVDFEMVVPYTIHYDGSEESMLRIARFAEEAIVSPHRHRVRVKRDVPVVDIPGARRMLLQLYVPITVTVQSE